MELVVAIDQRPARAELIVDCCDVVITVVAVGEVRQAGVVEAAIEPPRGEAAVAAPVVTDREAVAQSHRLDCGEGFVGETGGDRRPARVRCRPQASPKWGGTLAMI